MRLTGLPPWPPTNGWSEAAVREIVARAGWHAVDIDCDYSAGRVNLHCSAWLVDTTRKPQRVYDMRRCTVAVLWAMTREEVFRSIETQLRLKVATC